MRIAVVGATGRVGRHIVEVLRDRGHDVVPISRSLGVDVITGEGLDAALAGVDHIVDAASGPSSDEREATEFFTTATRNLQEAGQRAGVRRIVVLSIVGTDRFRGGYGAAKIVHERAMQAGPIPVCILRAAQFHEFVEQVLDWSTQGDVARVQPMRTQLVAARSVAEAAADLATAPDAPAPMVEIAGPRVEEFVDVATLFAAKTGRPLTVEAAPNPRDPNAELMETGALLPGPDAILAGPTFEEWLNTR
jgi:uncharacterized protein YbjT (DUF2867 family)